MQMDTEMDLNSVVEKYHPDGGHPSKTSFSPTICPKRSASLIDLSDDGYKQSWIDLCKTGTSGGLHRQPTAVIDIRSEDELTALVPPGRCEYSSMTRELCWAHATTQGRQLRMRMPNVLIVFDPGLNRMGG